MKIITDHGHSSVTNQPRPEPKIRIRITRLVKYTRACKPNLLNILTVQYADREMNEVGLSLFNDHETGITSLQSLL